MISIVDDDPLVRDATVDLLNSMGYPALAFETAEEFLNSGQVETTLCLITDEQLPGLDGLGLQNKLVANGSHVPVIFITNVSTVAQVDQTEIPAFTLANERLVNTWLHGALDQRRAELNRHVCRAPEGG